MIITDIEKLRVICSDVLPEEVNDLRDKLESELIESGEAGRAGIGLAAPQIGIAKKMALVRVPDNRGNIISVDLVNCRIKQAFDKIIFDQEGCLSFPDQIERTQRYREVYVVDNLIYPHSFIAEGLVAICIQHELDHLRGVLLPDVALDKNLPKNKISTELLDNVSSLLLRVK